MKNIMIVMVCAVVTVVCCAADWGSRVNYYAEKRVRVGDDYVLFVADNGIPRITTWNAAVIGKSQPSIATLLAPSDATVTAWRTNTDATATADYTTWNDRERKSLALTVKELNILRAWITSYKQAVADATSLADLKTRVAALPDLPARTPQQVKDALKGE